MKVLTDIFTRSLVLIQPDAGSGYHSFRICCITKIHRIIQFLLRNLCIFRFLNPVSHKVYIHRLSIRIYKCINRFRISTKLIEILTVRIREVLNTNGTITCCDIDIHTRSAYYTLNRSLQITDFHICRILSAFIITTDSYNQIFCSGYDFRLGIFRIGPVKFCIRITVSQCRSTKRICTCTFGIIDSFHYQIFHLFLCCLYSCPYTFE